MTLRTRKQAPPAKPCCSGSCHARGKVEVLATIHQSKGKRVNIDRALESIFDALSVDGSVDHVDALFLRVYRGTK